VGRAAERRRAQVNPRLYKCTIRDFSVAHSLIGGCVPEKAWQVHEMGVSGSGRLEAGDSSGDIFWIKNSEFLKYVYQTFPELMIAPPGTSGAASSSNSNPQAGDGGGGGGAGGAGAVGGGVSSVATKEGRPPVYDYFTVVSDELVQTGLKNGQYKITYLCLAGFGALVDTCHLHQLQRSVLFAL